MSAFLLVHVLTPALGVAVFLTIRQQMHVAGVANALLLPYFLIHAFYGGLLLIGGNVKIVSEASTITADEADVHLLNFKPVSRMSIDVRGNVRVLIDPSK